MPKDTKEDTKHNDYDGIIVRRCSRCTQLTLEKSSFCQGSGHQFYHSKCCLSIVFANGKVSTNKKYIDSPMLKEKVYAFLSSLTHLPKATHAVEDKTHTIDYSSSHTTSCVICLEGERNHAIVPCGHVILCDECSRQHTLRHCPMCRVRIQSLLKIFL
jgi:hypothetical protein